MDAAIRKGHPIMFGGIILFSIIEMCIAAWITAKYNANHNFPNSGLRARVRYILFISIWTIVLSSLYLGLFLTMAGSMISSVASHFVFLVVTWIFWLAAAAALTQSVGGALDCSTQTKFIYCGQLNALEGFAWLIWVLLTFMLIFVLIRGVIVARRGEGIAGTMVEV
ncbi:hypothetical protein BYT27DRAFT_7185025 [Phlegmacium glaucopus]|jgi:hypothetical protein|nr:hypothetical protein BYT27DRAFT_7185025 [Phlegmacium glaucopus]